MSCCARIREHPKNPYRCGNIFNLMFSKVFVLQAQFVFHLIVSPAGYANTTCFCQRLNPGCDIDTITVDIAIVFNDIAKRYAGSNEATTAKFYLGISASNQPRNVAAVAISVSSDPRGGRAGRRGRSPRRPWPRGHGRPCAC